MEFGEAVQSVIFRGLVEKRLEEIIGDANKDPRLTPDFLDVIELVEEGDFQEIENGPLNELYVLAGKKKVKGLLRREKNKLEVDRKEDRMRDYFTSQNGLMFPIFEDWLKFKGFEENEIIRRKSTGETRAIGRPDIFGTDEKGTLTKIELKARDYDPEKVSGQIARYLNTHKDSKLIFAAPDVDTKLFFGLKHFTDQKRIKFIELKEIDDDIYVFKDEVTPEDFENLPNEPEPVRKKRENNGLVYIMRDVPIRKNGYNGSRRKKIVNNTTGIESLTSEKEESVFSGAEEIAKGSFHKKEWEQISYVEKVACFARAVLPEKRYQVDGKMYDLFQRLRTHNENTRSVENVPTGPTIEEMEIVQSGIRNPLSRFVNKVLKYNNRPDGFDSTFESYMVVLGPFNEDSVIKFHQGEKGANLSNADIDKMEKQDVPAKIEVRIGMMRNLVKQAKDALGEIFDSQDYRLVAQAAQKKPRNAIEKVEHDILKRLVKSADKQGITEALEFLETKVARTGLLYSLDKDLAYLYACNHIEINRFIEKQNSSGLESIIAQFDDYWEKKSFPNVTPKEIGKYVNADNRMFDEIVSNFDKLDSRPYYVQVGKLWIDEPCPELEEGYSLAVSEEQYRLLKDLEENKAIEGLKESVELTLQAKDIVNSVDPSKHPEEIREHILKLSSAIKKRDNLLIEESRRLNSGKTPDNYNAQRLRLRELEMVTKKEVLDRKEDIKFFEEELEKIIVKPSIKAEERDSLHKEADLLCVMGFEIVFYNAQAELAALRKKRYEALHGVNETLADVYYTHAPNTMRVLKGKISPEKVEELYTGDEKSSLEFCLSDNQLYQELVGLVKPMELETRKTGMRFDRSVKHAHSVVPEIVYRLENVLNGYKPRHPKGEIWETYKAAVNGFIEDVLNNTHYSQSVRAGLADSLRASKGHEAGMDEMQVLNFFGDLRIYAARGKVPGREELRKMLGNLENGNDRTVYGK
ncbi:MAG: hypothetical protein Q7S74_04515 [Nanoarchaeota archaeon]|nr:hypothetical protein [Nanoarchaeota archaeon]